MLLFMLLHWLRYLLHGLTISVSDSITDGVSVILCFLACAHIVYASELGVRR